MTECLTWVWETRSTAFPLRAWRYSCDSSSERPAACADIVLGWPPAVGAYLRACGRGMAKGGKGFVVGAEVQNLREVLPNVQGRGGKWV